jgi:hypothetical protein
LELVGLVVLDFLGAFLAGGFFFVATTSRRGEDLTRTWGAYAARWRYHFAQGTTPERPFRITGSREGLDFFLEVDTRNGVATRLITRTPQSAVGRIVAAQGRGRRHEAAVKALTGDLHFNRVFDVRASDAQAVERVLRPAVRMALMRFPMRMLGAGLRLVVDGDQVIIEWAGGEVDVSELNAAHAIPGEVCREV